MMMPGRHGDRACCRCTFKGEAREGCTVADTDHHCLSLKILQGPALHECTVLYVCTQYYSSAVTLDTGSEMIIINTLPYPSVYTVERTHICLSYVI